jgi:hypothetical protein
MYIYRFLVLCVFALLVFISAYGCHEGFRPVDELEDIPRITKEELKAKMGDPAVNIIDVRYKPNWQKSDRLIAGASREEPMEVGSWAHKYPRDRMIVLYCD